MYRSTGRRCPGCLEPMREQRLEVRGSEVLVNLCPSCHGAYFDFVDGTPGVVARALVRASTYHEVPERDAAEGATCPDCEGPMSAHDDLDHVFRCEACWSVFCGRRGLSSLATTAAILERTESSSFLEKLVGWLLAPSSEGNGGTDE